MRQQSSLRRTFLFLQGPHGSFFPKLGRALEQAGQRVRRINFNGADHAVWPSGHNFRAPASAWPRYLTRFLQREGVTDIVLFGDCRPEHRAAVAVAHDLDVRVHVFEEGYIRPDWVTLERDGVNGWSTLSRDPAWYLEQAARLPAVTEHPPLASYASARGWAAFFYYAEAVLQHWRFPFYRSHRTRNPVWEGIQFLRRFRQRDVEQERTEAALRRLADNSYFIFPLQLDSDYQIRVHSRFEGMRPAIAEVVKSFARQAPADMMLVVKEHPLDAGLRDWRGAVSEIAQDEGVADRIVFLEHGDLLDLVNRSHGMVTVNSTSGTLALAAGKPVKTLGVAVYDIAGITDPQPLDRFWSQPAAPDPAIWDAFYRVLADRCLMHGAFLSNDGIERLVRVATDRLTSLSTIDMRSPIPTSK